MRSCLILTIGRDSHAVAVAETLSRLGEAVDVFSLSSTPGRDDLSIDVFDGLVDVRLGTTEYRGGESFPKSVWNRRSPPTFHMPDHVYAVDIPYIRHNVRDFTQALQVVFDGTAFLVNPLEGKAVTANKINQLRFASSVGLMVPRTTLSSDLAHVRRVFPTDRLCIKPLKVGSWRADDGYFASMTTIVESLDELDEKSAAVMPTIFQEYIEKAYEVRLTIFGGFACGTQINSQIGGDAAVDWRVDSRYLETLQPIVAPEDIENRCRDLLKRLGLRFGTFDFCVTPSGDWIFLEVNESGQFLWQEEFCPECRVLEPFSKYLAAADDGFTWDAKRASAELAFAEVKAEMSKTRFFADLYAEAPLPDSAKGVTDERQGSGLAAEFLK